MLVPAVPTNLRKTTIDLAFSNLPLATASIEDHLATGSNHFTIAITIPEISLQSMPAKRPQLRSPEDIQHFLQLVKAEVLSRKFGKHKRYQYKGNT